MKFKSIILIILVFACILVSTSCASDDAEDVTDSESLENTTVASDNSSEKKDDSYSSLQCRTIKSRHDVHFDLGSNYNIALSFSKDWTLEKSADGNSFDIKRDGNVIGTLANGTLESSEWTVADKFSRTSNPTLSVKKFIEKKGSDADAQYRYRFEYNCIPYSTPILISLCLDYVEIDANAADRLYRSPAIDAPTTVQEGMLSKVKDGNYLILGNSFIGTSNIGQLLDDMFALNNKNAYFNAISRGYAQVGTYTSDEGIMNSIKNGQYDAVFICGFYANNEADNLAILEKACNSSNTELIIFPAHNEFAEPIKIARNKCPNLKFLDWKGELDMLIADGVDKWALCYDDEHKHSTEFAGLIGAHMIYRAIYGEIPSIDGMYSINTFEAEELFGNYLKTGCVSVDYEVIKFN